MHFFVYRRMFQTMISRCIPSYCPLTPVMAAGTSNKARAGGNRRLIQVMFLQQNDQVVRLSSTSTKAERSSTPGFSDLASNQER